VRCVQRTLCLVALLAGLGLSATGSAGAAEIDAHFVEELHERHGHERWHNGRGDWRHTWAAYRQEAVDLRLYLRRSRRDIHRFGLVLHWAKVAECESTGRWSISTGNGYYGGLQFSMPTWQAYGGRGWPHHQPAWYQAQVADRVRTRSGLHHWPVCGRYYR
jgi:hypothetical protein